MNDETRLALLKLAKCLADLSKVIDSLAVRDCECKPGYPVCPACTELAQVIYGDNIPMEGEL